MRRLWTNMATIFQCVIIAIVFGFGAALAVGEPMNYDASWLLWFILSKALGIALIAIGVELEKKWQVCELLSAKMDQFLGE